MEAKSWRLSIFKHGKFFSTPRLSLILPDTHDDTHISWRMTWKKKNLYKWQKIFLHASRKKCLTSFRGKIVLNIIIMMDDKNMMKQFEERRWGFYLILLRQNGVKMHLGFGEFLKKSIEIFYKKLWRMLNEFYYFLLRHETKNINL